MRNRERALAGFAVLAVAPVVAACAALGLAAFAAAAVIFMAALGRRAWRVRPPQVRFPALNRAPGTLSLTDAQVRKALRS